jgi:hypothetical protein
VPLLATIVIRIAIILASTILVIPWTSGSTLGPALPRPRLGATVIRLLHLQAWLPLLVHHIDEMQSKIIDSS